MDDIDVRLKRLDELRAEGRPTEREFLKALRAVNASRDANEAQHVADLARLHAEERQWSGWISAMLAELIKRDGDPLAGADYISLVDVAAYFGVTSQTIKVWGETRNFPPPLGGWKVDGKRFELRFWKPQLRIWRALMHGADPERAEKLLASYAAAHAAPKLIESVKH